MPHGLKRRRNRSVKASPKLYISARAASIPAIAGVMELVDIPDLKSGGFGRAGSSPAARTRRAMAKPKR